MRSEWFGANDEESRAYLQARLAVMSKLMFWTFAVLLAAIQLMYWKDPHIAPDAEHSIFAIAAAGLVALAIVWRLALVRRTLAIRWLYAIDAFYALSSGSIFAITAYLARDFQPSGYACLLYTCFVILLRAIVVPSTGARTAVIGVVLDVPMVIAAIAIAIARTSKHELPAAAYVAGEIIVTGGVILLATIGSRILYGLRRQISAAMRLGQYTLDRKIGEGGAGAVYRGRHVLLRRPTAIKILRPEKTGSATLDRFEREVQHMSRLTHPNTVAVFDYGRNPDGVFYYAMEYLDGIDLERLVAEFGSQPADRVVAILSQVCRALHEAHNHGLVHRDVKPANIILCERGDEPDIAKVVDFGLVQEIRAEDAASTKLILGTPAYIAPEAVTDPSSVGPSADVYAVGAVGYFLLTGKRVFEGATPLEVCVQHVTATPRPPSQIVPLPAPLEAVIVSCLAKLPAERPTARALVKALRAMSPAGDWNEADALAWWVAFRRRADARELATAPTITITVDLQRRYDT